MFLNWNLWTYTPALTNATSRIAVLRLLTPTQDKVFDTKKGINGNPILLSVGLGTTVGASSSIEVLAKILIEARKTKLLEIQE